MYETKYYVWRRSDGYVSSTCYNPNLPGACPGDTFDILMITTEWFEARARIAAERGIVGREYLDEEKTGEWTS